MPMYYFHLRDNEPILDPDGTDLIDVEAARGHAEGVARELMFKTDGILGEAWSMWSCMWKIRLKCPKYRMVMAGDYFSRCPKHVR